MRWKDFKIIVIGLFFVVCLVFMIFFGAQELGRDREEKKISSSETEEFSKTKELEETSPEVGKIIAEDVSQIEQKESVNDGQNKKFTIQVGAFRDKLGAETLVEQLEKRGYKTTISVNDLGKEGTWYRVWAGDFDSKEKAAEFLPELKKEYFNSFIKAK